MKGRGVEMKTMMMLFLVAIGLFILTGCAMMVVPEPSKISLESALRSVGKGLVEMKQGQTEQNKGENFMTGLIPSEVEVTFNISASGTDNGKIYVEMSPIPASIPIPGKAGAELGTSYTAKRGNQITIKFRSLLFSKKTTVDNVVIIEGPTDPDLYKKIIEAIEETDGTVYLKDAINK